MNAGLAIGAVLIALYASIAVKLGRLSITMPMVFVVIELAVMPELRRRHSVLQGPAT